MIAAGGPAIVHIGSNAARLPRPAALAYAAAKAALATYSKGLASQVGRHNVRVNLVSPGVIETAALAARIRVIADQGGHRSGHRAPELHLQLQYPARTTWHRR